MTNAKRQHVDMVEEFEPRKAKKVAELGMFVLQDCCAQRVQNFHKNLFVVCIHLLKHVQIFV